MEEVFVVVLGLTVYLIVVNGYLNSSWKNKIDAVLAGIWFSLLAVALFVFGWRIFVGSILGSFVLGWLLLPVGRCTVFLLFRRRRDERLAMERDEPEIR